MSAHTSGPWSVNWAGSGKHGQLVYDEVYVYAPACGVDDVAVAADIADPLTGQPSLENARLIAAAPELFAVAKDFEEMLGELGLFCECGETDCRTTRLRAAIAKAIGEQP